MKIEAAEAPGCGSQLGETSAGSDAADEADQLLRDARDEERADARQFVGMGIGIGAIGALSAVAFGAVCPVCVVAAPALVAVGAAKHVKARRKSR